ncbi:hypothetical protein M0534_02075 [Methylonatrum kenyense]|uniref:hypothetical protein n=1 Tax=Methylonatrum kenyense TaxID=455253 RepID=UPI0020BF43C6|nr:hypothetical protein [Methylonatrum kenyense]MCK8515121.1 hypothetical protein [Methylonatrum kenyense]
MRRGHAGIVIALCASTLLAGCAGTGPAEGLHQPEGRWEIISHRLAPVSAMSDAEAESWHGRSLEFRGGSAQLPEKRCDQPIYEHRLVEPESYFGEADDVRAEVVSDLRRGDGLLQITELVCEGRSAGAAGGTLLWLGEDRALMPWDGVLFEIRRQ